MDRSMTVTFTTYDANDVKISMDKVTMAYPYEYALIGLVRERLRQYARRTAVAYAIATDDRGRAIEHEGDTPSDRVNQLRIGRKFVLRKKTYVMDDGFGSAGYAWMGGPKGRSESIVLPVWGPDGRKTRVTLKPTDRPVILPEN